MSLQIGVLKETQLGERLVAAVPRTVDALKKLGLDVLVQNGAGIDAGFPDREYAAKGALLLESPREIAQQADIVLRVRVDDSHLLRPGHTVIGFCDPLASSQNIATLAERGITLFALDLMPRITRTQSMDALSSLASIAGYKAVLLAAGVAPRIFPMSASAAGTLPPAKVLVLGAGVAGLQAIATALRLGAVVQAYDVRSAAVEQVRSLGAQFVEIQMDACGEGEDGYAQVSCESAIQSQRRQLADLVRQQDVLITTAAMPGKRAPVLVTREMVRGMNPGAVIVDLAVEHGGNCELTRPGFSVIENGVTIIGPLNLPSTVPHDASQVYARNVCEFVKYLLQGNGIRTDAEDEIVRATLVAREGMIVNDRIRGLVPAAEIHA